MFLELEYKVQSGDMKKIHVNVANLATMAPPDGKMAEKYNTVMFTANGHALYSKLEPDLIIKAFQGNVITEDSLLEWAATADQAQAELDLQNEETVQ